MAKKILNENFILLSIVGVVAIVGIIALVIFFSGSFSIGNLSNSVSKSENLAGMAYISGTNSVHNDHSPLFTNIPVSSWLNRDTEHGSGDYESASDFSVTEKKCSGPVFATCKTTDGLDWYKTDDLKTFCTPTGGIVCKTVYQSGTPDNYCENYKIKFGCGVNTYLSDILNKVSNQTINSFSATNGVFDFDKTDSSSFTFSLTDYGNFSKYYPAPGVRTEGVIGNNFMLGQYDMYAELVAVDVEDAAVLIKVTTPFEEQVIGFSFDSILPYNPGGNMMGGNYNTQDYIDAGYLVVGGLAIKGFGLYSYPVTDDRWRTYNYKIEFDYTASIPTDSPLRNQSKTITFNEPKTLTGNDGILHYKYWGSNYYYADGYCQVVQNCEKAVDVTLVADGLRSCRCETGKFGCATSCASASGSWQRFKSITCGGC